MSSKQTKKDESRPSSLQTFIADNKLVLSALIALSAGAYFVLKSRQQKSKVACSSADAGKTSCYACTSSTIQHGTPMDAFKHGPREKLLFTTATRTDNTTQCAGGDFVAVVDVDPSSPTYAQIISTVELGKGEEVHHTGWNACASCFGVAGVHRQYLIVPAFTSGNIHIIDVSNERQPKLYKTVSGARIKREYGLSYPHTTHCLANGNLMISYLGVDESHTQNRAKPGSDFLLFDEQFEVCGRWVKDAAERPTFGYDYWYQPFHNVMISTEWGTPDAFSAGFDLSHVKRNMYGSSLHFWDWSTHKLVKTVKFPLSEVCMPLEIRFCHDPKSVHAFCGAALTSNILHIFKDEAPETKQDDWVVDADYIRVDGVAMANWALPNMPGLVTDILLSMDDKYLYFSNWLHGDIRQYDISDPMRPKLNSQCWVGGCLRSDSGFAVKDAQKNPPPSVPKVKGRRVEGGPQMLQLSLDGRRLYVTNSLYSAYDKQFYPDMVRNGGQMLCIDIDLDNDGKMSLNTEFLVDFGACKGGPARPHEMRYPGGDCTSDIYLVQQ